MAAAVLLLAAFVGPDDPAALVERLRTEDAAERRKVLGELLRLGAEGARAALRALEAAPADPSPRVEALVRRLSSPEWKERDAAMRALADAGAGARDALLPHRDAADPEVAWRVRAALVELAERAPAEERLRDARDAALCELLAETGEARAADALLGLAAAPGRPADLRRRALVALGRLRDALSPEQAGAAAEAAFALLEGTADPRERAILVRALGRLRAPSALRPLAALAGDRSERNVHLRAEALRALAGLKDPGGARAVVEALGADDLYLRAAAAPLLTRLAGEAFGFDPAEPSPAALEKARAWWSKTYKQPW